GAYGRVSPAYMVMDGVIPRTKLPYVLSRVNEIVAAHGLRVGNVFHAGDGNLHPNILYDPRKPGEEARVVEAGAEMMRLCAEVGATNVLGTVELAPYVVEGRTPEAARVPGSVDEVRAVVEIAAGAGIPIVPWGGGTAAAVGTPTPQAGIVLDLKRLGQLVEHEPRDLTATVEAGMTMAALQSPLRARGQWLSLDPPDPAQATIGGVIAANASGPRRHLYGTARDLLIGVTVVTGDGVVVRGGGKVVKNVAGYDLPKLFVGSHGTLGVIVSVTVKLRPLPDDER